MHEYTRCLSQARKNWEDCVRKGIRHKNVGGGGLMEVRALIAQKGWRPSGLSEQLPLLSSPAPSKTRRMESTTNDIGCNPVGAPTCLCKQVGKPSQNAAQHCCVIDGPCRRRDALWEGWGFGVGTWTVSYTHLTLPTNREV